MNSGTLSGIVTVVFIAVFIGIVWWAYSKRNRQDFEDAGRLPFEEDVAQYRRDNLAFLSRQRGLRRDRIANSIALNFKAGLDASGKIESREHLVDLP